jgi:hypothetical protein
MFRRHHVLVAVTAVAMTGVLAAGCAEDEKATPRVTFTSEVTKGSHSVAECPETGTWFTIGSFGTPGALNPDGTPSDPVKPVDNGGSDQQGSATVSCSVIPEGDGFRVAAQAALSGATGGSFLLQGLFRKEGDQPNITISLTRTGVTYRATDCVAQYTEPNMTTAAGRVWATVVCANVEAPSAQRTCQARATFRFENCDQ